MSTILKALGALAGIAATIYGFNAYVESRVEKVVSTKEFLNRVASRVRPALIFDADESILSDAGGLQHIERIEIQKSKNKNAGFPSRIILTPKHLMTEAPLLTCLDPVWFKISTRRGKGLAWVYELEPAGHMGGFDPIRFRLEIAPE